MTVVGRKDIQYDKMMFLFSLKFLFQKKVGDRSLSLLSCIAPSKEMFFDLSSSEFEKNENLFKLPNLAFTFTYNYSNDLQFVCHLDASKRDLFRDARTFLKRL